MNLNAFTWPLLLVVLGQVACKRPAPRCLNSQGEVVDWWFIYKVAQEKGKDASTGFKYLYFDSLMAQSARKSQPKFLPVWTHTL